MTDQPTNYIMLSAPPTKEVIRIDEEGFHYKGEFIADAGEAHRLMVEFLNQNTPQPEPVAPTDEEIMELMPQQMRDDLAAAASALACALAITGFERDSMKAAGACRIILNRHAVDHARAVLARWGQL